MSNDLDKKQPAGPVTLAVVGCGQRGKVRLFILLIYVIAKMGSLAGIRQICSSMSGSLQGRRHRRAPPGNSKALC